ncbi:MAG: RimK/LysX family protein [Thermoanaerobaculia bacterium]
MALNIWNRRWWWSHRVLRCASACLFVMVLLARPASPLKKEILGWIEHVRVGRSRLELTAKLDTGADTSSLDANKIRRFRGKDGRRWVEFLVVEDHSGRRVRFKKPLVRTAYIKEHKGPSQKRSVVLMEICLGEYLQKVEVTLVDRSGFAYPVLLGRNALEGLAVIDPALTLTSKPRCPIEEKK